jgi:Fe-S-cluster containining protein
LKYGLGGCLSVKQPISYEEMVEKVEKINTRNYDYDQSFFDVVDQVLDESEGKHVKTVLIESFEKLLSQVDTEIEKIESEVGLHSACQLGCAHCCYFPIIVTRLEAKLMMMFINRLPEERKQKIVKQVSDYNDAFTSKLTNIEQINFQKDDSFKRKYKELDLPCVFLDSDTNRCLVYEVRPIPCRTYVNYVDANVCSNELLPKEPVSFEFMHHFYVQGMDEIIQEILEVIEDKSLGFSYPSDAADVNYLPLLLREELK